MTKIASLLATILISTSAITPVLMPAAAHAAAGHRFVSEGISSPQELKGMILRSLQKDPTGASKVDGGYATANDFLIAFKGEDPGAGLTDMASLLQYLDQLVETTPEKGVDYTSSLMLDNGSVDIDGEARPFDGGEKAWMNPKTKKIVLAARCANPVGVIRRPIEVQASPCAFIHAGTHPGDTFAAAVVPDHEWADNGHCLAVKLPGQKDFAELVDNCASATCFNKAEEQIGRQAKFIASYKVTNGGTVIVRVPMYFTSEQSKASTILCDTQSNGTKSCGKLIVNKSYVKGHAYVTYKGEEKPGEVGVNWHWSNEIQCPEGSITW
jgi:hypothetical protein